MKKVAVVLVGILLALTTQAQCFDRYFSPKEYKEVYEERFDKVGSILYRKYLSTKGDTVTLNYVEEHSFSDREYFLRYEDEAIEVFGHYFFSEDCSFTVGKGDDESEIYVRTYHMEVSDDFLVREVIVKSDYADFHNLHSVTIKKMEGYTHSYIF